MKEFRKWCKAAERISPLEYGVILAEKTGKVLPALRELSGNTTENSTLLAIFIIASVYADGKLDETEYALMRPMLERFFGQEVNFEEAKAVVKAFSPEGEDLKKIVDKAADMIGEADPELKRDIITVCLLICAIDGKITRRERKYIKQLIQ